MVPACFKLEARDTTNKLLRLFHIFHLHFVLIKYTGDGEKSMKRDRIAGGYN